MRPPHGNDRGASLVEYAIVVALIALASLGVVANVGEATSDSFDTVSDAFVTADGEAESQLTPKEKWEKAQEDYKQAVADAKSYKQAAVAAAKAEYQAAVQANKSLPKPDKKTANAAAKAEFNTAKTEANSAYQAAVQNAKDARAEAKAEYNASK